MSQPNQPSGDATDWVEFWATHRLGHQIRACPSCTPIQELGAKCMERLPQLFPGGLEVQPSLLHGDLWGGNHAVCADTGLPTIYDPAWYILFNSIFN